MQWLLVEGPNKYPDLFDSEKGQKLQFNYSLYFDAIYSNDLSLLQWLYSIHEEIDNTVFEVLYRMDIEMLEWLMKEMNLTPVQGDIDLTLNEENWEVLGWLTQYGLYPNI